MIRPRSLCRLSLAVLTIATVLATGRRLSAQDFFETVEVPLVEVEVLVVDRQGDPVRSLGREDFELLVDGRLQEIEFFVSPPSLAGDDRAASRGSETRTLAIVFDDSVEAMSRNAVIAEYRQFLRAGSDPDLQILVATVGGAGLAIRQELTSDRSLVDAALVAVAQTATRNRYVDEYESLLTDIQRLAGARDPTRRDTVSQTASLTSRILAFAERSRATTLGTVGDLMQLIDGMAGLDGPKAILFIGGAMAQNPGNALLSALKGILDRSVDEWARRAGADLPASLAAGEIPEMDRLTFAASLRGVRVSSLLVGGSALVSGTGSTAAIAGTGDSSTMDAAGIWSPEFDSRTRSESRTALDLLAAATGGAVFTGSTAALPALERLHEQLRSLYLVGFHPAGDTDGGARPVEIRSSRPGLVIRHRRHFRVWSWDEETATRLRSALFFGSRGNPLALTVEVGEPEPRAEDLMRYPLTIRLPLDRLALVPIAEDHRAQASVFVVGQEPHRLAAGAVRKSVLPVVLPNDELAGSMGRLAEYRLEIDLEVDSPALAVAVRDDLSTVLAIQRIEVPQHSDPIASRGAGGWEDRSPDDELIHVRLPTAALLMSGQQGGRLRLTAATSPGADGEPTRAIDVRVSPPPDPLRGSDLDLEIHVYVLDRGGRPVSRSSRRGQLEGTAEGSSIRLTVELPAGSESLRILARDRRRNDFGLIHLALAESAGKPQQGTSGTVTVELRRQPDGARDRAAILPSAPSPESDLGAAVEKADLEGLTAGFVDVLELFAQGRTVPARTRLRELETAATSGRSPMAVVDLGRKEARVLLEVANGAWGRWLPLAVLWGELIEDYRQRRQGPLAEHAITMSTELASRMARQSESPTDRVEAAQLLVSLAGSLLYAQRLARTEELLDLAVRVDPEQVTGHLAVAAVREQRGDFAGAIAGLRELLDVAPQNEEGRLRLAINLARTGRIETAERQLEELAGSAGDTWIAQVATQERARLLALTGREDEAIRFLEGAAGRWSDQPAIEVQLAWLLDQVGRREAAADRVERLVQATNRMQESARFRYHQWYVEGLVTLRRELEDRAVERAAESMAALGRFEEVEERP